MIKINLMKRGEGKTTKVIGLLKLFPQLTCIVPHTSFKSDFPEEVRNQVLILSESRGKKMTDVVLDEGFMYSPSQMAKMYYEFGAKGINVTVFGTEQ